MRRQFLLLLIILPTGFLIGQDFINLWTDVAESTLRTNQERVIIPEKGRTMSLETQALRAALASAPLENTKAAKNNPLLLALPNPGGGMDQFAIYESPIMEDGLATKFPAIKTYAGKNLENPSILVRFDLTIFGFHAMVMAGDATYFIDPYYRNASDNYISYYKKDFQTDKTFVCEVGEAAFEMTTSFRNGPNPVGEELRTYRLAVATKGAYAQYFGGTVEGALSGIVTTMNRVNGVYERDVSVRMILIENNDLIIFTDSNTDPYGSGSELGTNQEVIDEIIGNENYDIGHLFDVGGGGVAFLQSVCNPDFKARGYTSLNPPTGDPFDIDYVAHEMGHQYGGNHTFNSISGACNGNGNPNTSYEPGSATTIMGYAGICGSDNLQLNSDDHFHVISFDEMAQFTLFGGGNNCPVVLPTENTPPTVDAGPGGWIIPLSTPFELEGAATDVEEDSLTFCWEQFDLGPFGSPNNPEGNAPLFRSFSPTTNPVRVFPRIADLVNNTTSIGERLPDYARDLTFRLTVRDNFGFGGGVDHDEIQFSVTDIAGPFRVTSQNDGGQWIAGSTQQVEWDIANTNIPPISASEVNIYLSLDGGFTYPILLKENTPNDGIESILVPDTLSENVRVKVKAAGNIFFDINDEDIAIETPTAAGFFIEANNPNQVVCSGDPLIYDFEFSFVLDQPDMLELSVNNLPEGLEAMVESEFQDEVGRAQVEILGAETLAPDDYNLQLEAISGAVSTTIGLGFSVFDVALNNVALVYPIAEQLQVSTLDTFFWEPIPNAIFYEIEVATDPDFTDVQYAETLLDQSFFSPENPLIDSTNYYWRVRAGNESCGFGPFSEALTFTTEVHRCISFFPNDTPVPFDNFPFLISRIDVPENLPIRDVNVLNIQGEYTPVSDLLFRLTSPQGPTIELIPKQCDDETSFDISLDDEAEEEDIPCPYNDGGTYEPEDRLAVYDDQDAIGQWRLFIFDQDDEGQLDNWELEICYALTITNTEEKNRLPGHFAIYPNPSREQVVIDFEIAAAAALNIQVFSLAGQLLHQSGQKTYDSGHNRTLLNLKNLPAGMLLLHVVNETGSRVFTEKLIKQ